MTWQQLLPQRSTAMVILGLLAWTACKNGPLKHIEIDGADSVTVERGTVLEELVGGLGFDGFTAMDLTDSSELQNQGVKPGDISTAKLVEFTLEATAPPEGDLSFMERMEIYVEGPDLPRQLLASAGPEDFAEGVEEVSFLLEDVDLVEYVVSESLTLETSVSGSRPDEDTTVEARYVIDVGVTAQGVRSYACGSDEE